MIPESKEFACRLLGVGIVPFLGVSSGLLNFVVAVLLVKKRDLLERPYYAIILLFNISVIILGFVNVIDHVLINIMEGKFFITLKGLLDFTTDGVLYFTSCLMFLIGLNRMAIFFNGKFHDTFTKRKVILACAFILCILSLLGAMCSTNLLHYLFVFSNPNWSETSDPLFCIVPGQHVEDLFVSLYLVTWGLFIATYVKLKKNQIDAVSRPTQTMLGKAERSILRQGFFILGCAMMNVTVCLLTRFNAMDMLQYEVQELIVSGVHNLSHIGIPLVVLLSVEFRRHFRSKFQRPQRSFPALPNHHLRERSAHRVCRTTVF